MSPVRFDLKGKRIYVAGHRGMAGSALMRRLASEDCELITADRQTLDLTDQAATERFLAQTSPPSFSLPPPGWAAFMPTTPIQPISSPTTWRSP